MQESKDSGRLEISHLCGDATEPAGLVLPKLLLVDDKDENLFTLKRVLASVEGEMHTASSGSEALSLMLKHDYAVVLLDVQMPDMDGFETASLMREHAKTRDTPVIFVTALSKEQRYIKAGYATGAVDYLLKPIDPGILLSKVRVFLELEASRNGLRQNMSALDRMSRRQNLILNCANEGIIGVGADGYIMFSNPAAESLLKSEPGGLCGRHLSTVFASDAAAQDDLEAVIRLIKTTGQHRSENAQFNCLDGSSIPVDYSCAAIVANDHDYAGGVLVFNDITERKNVETQLTRLARYDELTGLANRSLFREFLRKTMARAKRQNRMMGLLFLDLDRFKAVNDELGHAAGDALLVEVGARLKNSVRESDLVARLGGDEFAVVLDEIDSSANAGQIAEKFLSELSRPVVLEGRSISAFTSIGISIYHGDAESAETLIKKADKAMYEAKRYGRNGFRYYSDRMNDNATSRGLLENDLKRAIGEEKLEVYYQPQVCAKNAQVVGFEALVRWFDKHRGSVSPAEFIPIAENSGLIEDLGAFVMRDACRNLALWREVGLVERGCRMAVNVSVMQLHSGRLPSVVMACLSEFGLDPKDIEVELTESTVMDDAPAAIEQLSALSELGARIAIDDFGTGYSSLSYLQRLPIDTLKIDGSFVNALDADASSAPIVKSILALADSLNLHTVAEGVESESQVEFLRKSGCDVLQGFYFAKPESAQNIMDRLSHESPNFLSAG